MEAYLAAGKASERNRDSWHLLLLAENEIGYRNLLKLASKAALEGFYYRPRIDMEMLQEHHEGIIATSACLGGPVANPILKGNEALARRNAGALAEIFGPERFFIELQDHGLKEQIDVNRSLIPLAREFNLPLVATNDVHYCSEADAPYQDILVCVQTNTTIHDTKRLKQDTNEFYLKGPEQMERLFGEVSEALTNTMRIAEMCNLDLGFKGYQLPNFTAPDGLSNDEYLDRLVHDGIMQRYGHVQGDVKQRVEYELGIIKRMGFVNYFLVVWDFVKFAKDNGILVGPGRGSAAGSIVTYALGITALDPLKYDLLFERFLNPDRISMPDIDIDFADDGRDQVIRYVVDKYGDDHVAQIVTFGTLAAKASVRDVGRALGMDQFDVDKVARLIPVGPKVTIESSLKSVSDLKQLYETDDRARNLIEHAQKLEGVARHSSTHAAGVVISRDPLVEHVPLQRAGGKAEGDITTQYPMGILEDLGLLKMDFLGLRTLSVIGKAVELANAKDPNLTIDTIPLEDPAAYEMLRRGETVGIFQLEGGMTTRMTIDVQPSVFEDLIALMALIRPGPMELAPDYIARKHGREPIDYLHPLTEPFLKETYGIAIYQEQIMRLANTLAGFSMSEGDGLRKAMGKKLPEVMDKYRQRFIDGCGENTIPPKRAAEIFDLIEKFAGYGFNKSHSAAYAVIAAQTAYLKANYPVEFMAAFCSTEMGNTDRIVANVVECRRAGIDVLPPDVNVSGIEFTVEKLEDGSEAIRFGLGAIKNLGRGAAEAILGCRSNLANQRFATLEEFTSEIDWSAINKRAVEAIGRAGGLDSFGPRGKVLGRLENAITAGQAARKAADRGQMGLFDMGAIESAPKPVSESSGNELEVDQRTLLDWEKEHLGLFLSDHPLTQVFERYVGLGIVPIREIPEREVGSVIRMVGMVSGVRRITTRNNTQMAIVDFQDVTGNMELVLFAKSVEQWGHLFETDAILDIKAKIEKRNEQIQLLLESATNELREHPAPVPREDVVQLRMPLSDDKWTDNRMMQRIDAMLQEHEGDCVVIVTLVMGQSEVTLKSRSRRVDWTPMLQSDIEEVLGEGSVQFITPREMVTTLLRDR
jgi:DNA polymerase-3 subunit alpha